jgi:hypothetical protein
MYNVRDIASAALVCVPTSTNVRDSARMPGRRPWASACPPVPARRFPRRECEKRKIRARERLTRPYPCVIFIRASGASVPMQHASRKSSRGGGAPEQLKSGKGKQISSGLKHNQRVGLAMTNARCLRAGTSQDFEWRV